MSIGEDELERLESLARIRIDPADRKGLREDLSRIIGFVGRLGKWSGGIARRGGPGPSEAGRTRMRKDAVTPCLPRDEVLSMAPDPDGPYFRVPPVIESDDAKT